MTLSITTLIKNDTKHNKIAHNSECLYAECRDLLFVMLNVIILSVVMLNVVAPHISLKQKITIQKSFTSFDTGRSNSSQSLVLKKITNIFLAKILKQKCLAQRHLVDSTFRRTHRNSLFTRQNAINTQYICLIVKFESVFVCAWGFLCNCVKVCVKVCAGGCVGVGVGVGVGGCEGVGVGVGM